MLSLCAAVLKWWIWAQKSELEEEFSVTFIDMEPATQTHVATD